MLNYSISEFYGVLFQFGCFVFFSLIGFKGIFMLISRFMDKENTMYHHHFHYKDRRGK